jgi:translocation and assembly module TamB
LIRRPALLVVWTLELWLALMAALAAGLWFWSGTEGSLAAALQWAERVLPPGQQLQAQGVRGTLRQGGGIDRLHWTSGDLSVDLQRLQVHWQPWALLERKLVLDRLQVGTLEVDDRRPASAEPTQDLSLPMQLDVTLSADNLHWIGPPELRASAVSARYRYDGTHHLLAIDRAQVAQGRYQGQVSLMARAPLTLDLQARGQVRVALDKNFITLDADASLRGSLARRQDTLQLRANVQPAAGGAGPPGQAPAIRAALAARGQPWAAQPVLDAQARFSQLDLAALWPGAPQTLLTGEAQVQPRGDDWRASARLGNGLAGPWDKHRVPVTQAQALVVWAGGAWTIESLHAQSAGGTVDLQGRLDTRAGDRPGAAGWQGNARLAGINPALMHSVLAPARIGGALQASSNGPGIDFDASLQPEGVQPAASPLTGLRLQRATARGSWSEGLLRLQNLLLQTNDASVTGNLDLRPATWAGHGQLQLVLPGAKGRLDGQIEALDGGGDLALDVSDAGRMMAWLQRLPQLPPGWMPPDLQGRADLTLHWQGGWQALRDGQGVEPRLQALVRVPELTLRTPDRDSGNALGLQAARIELVGTARALSVTARGNLLWGARRFNLQTQGQGGRLPTGDWHLTLQALRVDMPDPQDANPWTLALREPVLLDWLAVPAGGSLRTGAVQAQLTGPWSGTALLDLQALSWRPGPHGGLASQGQLRNLRMEWLALLGNTSLSAMGLSGDLVFDASWDLDTTDSLKLRAGLVRRSGDIRVLTDNLPGTADAGTVVDAGVRDARVTLVADADAITATARWDSERAGIAQAEFSTRLSRGTQGWTWPSTAPLRGTVTARLPQVGVWSVLAPPGWRIRGTLDTSLVLAGTREAAQWSGQILAEGLALRSVVDGFEFGNGRLRSHVQGQRLIIDEFSLQGAGGAAGGTLHATGYALWLPQTGSPAAGDMASRVQIDLDADVRALRVSARADRRMVVSGNLRARLRNNRLDVQGALKADQASFVLPDENAPQLGDDVVIRIHGATGATPAPNGTTSAAAPSAPGKPVQTTLSLALDLGPDFRVQGRGIATRLSGTLQLRAAAGELPRLTGDVRTVRGSYKAYGQLLDVEQGVLRFTGAYDNPVLDILALRPNLTQRVGVQITGTAFAPRVRLFAEPELPEAEKLAWLVLGRSGANGGAEAAVLQQAAMALLGRNGQGLSGGLASALGLDELSIAAAASRGDGSTSAATVTLGKRISRDFYVAYERSLAGTLGTISIFYDLSRRFTLRASTGEQSAIDLIFTIRYD